MVALPSGVDYLAYYGFTSGQEYVVACCAEDINGVVGPVKLVHVTTKEIKPGANPKVSIKPSLSEDGSTITCVFEANEDTKMMKYFAADKTDQYFYTLSLDELFKQNSYLNYNDYIKSWTEWTILQGLQSQNLTSTGTYKVPTDKSPVLVCAIAIGEKDGEDCYSDLAHVIYYDGAFHDLSEYRTPPAK